MEQTSMRDYSYTIGRLPELKKQLEKVEDHMSDKGYEVAPLEDIPKRNDPWDERKPDKEKTMNDRIKELWDLSKTSGIHPEFGEYDMYSAEKFAELIVKRCVSLMEFQKISPKDDGAYNSALSLAQRNIKEHFRVE